jgi:hypothetical protein
MNLGDNEKEIIQMWKETTLPHPFDPHQLANEIAAKVTKFDRTVYWRNFREYAAGGFMIAWFLWLSGDRSKWNLTIPGLLAVSFVMLYLWRSHRKRRQALDPAIDLNSYRAALLERYDRQIRLLSTVKYWYVLPLYAWMVSVGIMVPVNLPGGAPAYFTAITLFAAFIVWLNESYGVRKLRAARDNAAKLTEQPPQ